MPSIEIAGRTALVDQEDLHHLAGSRWAVRSSGSTGYMYRYLYDQGKYVGIEMLHRLITACPEGKVVDHINGDGMDNRRANLRICSQAENLRNRKIHSNNKCGIKGVSYDPSSSIRPWRAKINVDRRRISLGRFACVEDAQEAYRTAAKKYHGEFACFA
ncbi:HNH endonuclease [Pseudomonas syringae group genomosp. 3]|uniref:HNH endonuclease n=1 Tax=Pseudomonas syringae group genomosp. 3 TaxID=251701 RepID=UPI000CF0712B|nr:HNH endonuclease [Pseudomonas syringae group genomosp. 3]